MFWKGVLHWKPVNRVCLIYFSQSWNMIRNLLIDALSLSAVGIPIFLIKYLVSPARLGFFCSDTSLRLPYHPSTVTTPVNVTIRNAFNNLSLIINPAFYKLNNFIIEIVEQFLQLWSANHCNCHPQLSSKVGWKHLNKKSSAQLLQSSHSLPHGSLLSSGMSKTFLAAIASLSISSLVIASLVIVLSDFIDGHWVLWLRVARVWL